ncbi:MULTISPECIES: aconitase X catalytic domain-containing protein [Sphingobium]|uniref:aconitase X catalytic domain-containing protein n=1 Tax=Sphingobium TaxID=165695 RepID=UPI0017D23B5E|nr:MULTISPECIES: aconitase X catalytic domain-containing protein [Sphingobium]MCW2363998.1 putative aconitase [Sphingobium sp. B10D3B]MCW2382832.1 putative aconitase [Sphingobium sp. B2D3B]MCW2396995.1 putative aconitase [Sphingobium sp. B2D3C]MCW2402605.1 putative aconitase [Sphingobium sp. B10D7B]MCW2409584.1 putative aconitase [Sphingobium xanthum]
MVMLTDAEQAMLDGESGAATQKAMELLIRYADALGAERFVETNNVAGVPGSAPQWVKDYYAADGGDYRAVFSRFDLDSDEVVDVPRMNAFSCHLQGGMDPTLWQEQGMTAEAHDNFVSDEAEVAAHGIQILKTCTPYLAGNVPVMGEHCAWMESSAVVFANSVIGARTNCEGRESTSAAMLAKRIPDWGFHRDDFRKGQHSVDVQVPVDSIFEWGMLGYFVGDAVQDTIPVITGDISEASLIRHKHFGAAAASSGGVEMYHMVGITPEAPSVETAFGGAAKGERFVYDAAARRRIYETLNSVGSSEDVDYVMLGCPHYSIEQIAQVCALIEGRKVSANSALWVFTSRAVKATADANGYSKILRDAGAYLMTDTCSAISQAVPKGTKVAALDSAKQVHYLPAMMGIEGWYGTTADCVDAACTGKWKGALA